MTTTQKVIKYLALAFAFFLIFNIISGLLIAINSLSGILGLRKANNIKTEYVEEISSNIEMEDLKKLEIDIDYSNLKIQIAESFKVESDNKNVKCMQYANKLIVKEEDHNWISNKEASEVIIYIPTNIIFEEVKIETGAGEIYIEELETKRLDLEIGAGKTEIDKLIALDNAKIDGGAGKVNINSGEMSNLDLDMGVGEIVLNSKLTGRSNIDSGVGRLEINLEDSFKNYSVKVSKGIGSISIDGKQAIDGETYGNGDSYIKISGGIGEIVIK